MIWLIKAMRVPDCLLLVVVGIIGFKYAGIPYNIPILFVLFLIITVTMLQNDWRDRFHDIGKGKRAAIDHPRLFLAWLISFWILCIASILLVSQDNYTALYPLLGLALVGLVYSEARRVPLLSATIVSFTVASSTLLPLLFGASFQTMAPLFIAIAFLMFGRENLHDIADAQVDAGYKKTLPIVFGDRPARWASIIALLIGCALFVYLFSPLTLLGSCFILWGLNDVNKETQLIKVRKRIDFGFLLLGLVLLWI